LGCKKTIMIFSLCFFSCASGASVRDNRPFAYLTDSSRFMLLPSEDIENSMDMAQQISAHFAGGDYFLNAYVQADEMGMGITLLNELGANMGELSYRNGAVSLTSAVFPKSLRPEYIIADFQLCFYSASRLRSALEDCGLLFEHTETGRRILQGETVIIEIEKKPGAVMLTNHLRGYAYTLEGDFE